MDLLSILNNQIIFFATTLLVGFLSVKSGFITSENVDSLSKILLRIIVPFLVLTLVGSSGSRKELLSMMPFFTGSVITFFILLVVAAVSAKLLGYRKPLANVHICSSTFVNSALLGYPIVITMFPSESGLAIATFLVAETIIMWTVGVAVLSAGSGKGKIDLKKMITPVTISLVIALGMLMLDFNPKGVVWDSLYGIGATNKYLGLIYIGADIGRRGFKKLFERPKVFLVSPFKLVISPLLVFLVLRGLGFLSYNHIMILTIFSMLPSMMIITMLSQEYNCVPEYASAALLSTTVISLATMPFVFWLVTTVL